MTPDEATERLLEPRARDIIVIGLMGAAYEEDAAEMLVESALATERKATVERIRAALDGRAWTVPQVMGRARATAFVGGQLDVLGAMDDILDAELSASPETDSQAER